MLVIEVLGGGGGGGGGGRVLSQLQADGSEWVVGYGSRTLSKAERNYCVTRRELLVMVYFVKHFRPYLLGRKFTLHTDHGALKCLNADALSRLPCVQCGQTDDDNRLESVHTVTCLEKR